MCAVKFFGSMGSLREIEDALKECGSDLQRTVEFCIQRSDGMELDVPLGPTSDEDAHLALTKDMVFHVRDITFC